MRNLITFKTHVDNDMFRLNLAIILANVAFLKNHDFLILFNKKDKDIDVSVPFIQYDKNTKICNKNNYDFWFRGDIPLIHAYEKLNGYDFYYQIEYDCRMNNWKKLFNILEHDESDMLCTWLKDQNREPKWCWWNEHNIDMRNKKLLGCYFPIVRLSNKACKTLQNLYTNDQNLNGYAEVFVPSLLNRESLDVKDIGDITGYLEIRHKNEDLLRYKRGLPREWGRII